MPYRKHARHPQIVDPEVIRAVSLYLNGARVEIRSGDFKEAVAGAAAGDFVYFDPPYAPLSMTANFNRYTGFGFSAADQRRLQQLLITLADRGVHVLLSNSVAPSMTSLYENNAAIAEAGFRTWRFPARRSVNSRPDRRGLVEELVVSNIPPRAEPGESYSRPA